MIKVEVQADGTFTITNTRPVAHVTQAALYPAGTTAPTAEPEPFSKTYKPLQSGAAAMKPAAGAPAKAPATKAAPKNTK